MHRRTVLGGLLLAFGCTPTGRRLADTPLPNEDDELPPPPAEPLVFLDPGALEPVAGHGRRPLLILVIPAGEELRWRRGRAFGEFLNHGDDASVAPLALFAVSCAPMSELRETYRELRGDREPWLVVVDRTLETPVARALEDEGLDASIEELGSEREIDPRIARLAALVRAAAEPAMVARLAKLEESALAPSL